MIALSDHAGLSTKTSGVGRKVFEIQLLLYPSELHYETSMLTLRCQWKIKGERKQCAAALVCYSKKVNMLTVHSVGCL